MIVRMYFYVPRKFSKKAPKKYIERGTGVYPLDVLAQQI